MICCRLLPLAGLLIWILGGCAAYRVGQPGSPAFATMHVEPVQNDSTYPLLSASLTAQLRKAIADSGYLTIAGPGEAEAILKTQVASVRREIAAAQSIGDVGRGRKFELVFEVLCTLYPNGQPNAPLFANRLIEVRQPVLADSGQVNAEYQAAPVISRKIARRVADTVIDTW